MDNRDQIPNAAVAFVLTQTDQQHITVSIAVSKCAGNQAKAWGTSSKHCYAKLA
jgi:hypothetical protein